MAKSTRSKWKKLHRRQKAKEEYKNTLQRVAHLHHKLQLTAKGGISAVPPQQPEKRFHFVNPEQDTNVPNHIQGRNNNYTLYGDDQRGRIDFGKPLRLPVPRTNFYGKSNPQAPHPMTVQYERVDADTPLGGHALTKADVERQVRKQIVSQITNNDNDNEEEADELSDAPEEYVFGLDDTAPLKVKTKKTVTTTTNNNDVTKVNKAAKMKKNLSKGVKTTATDKEKVAQVIKDNNFQLNEESGDEKEEEGNKQMQYKSTQRGATRLASSTAPVKIASMQNASKKGNTVIAAKGSSKAKRLGSESNASVPRVKRSTKSSVSGSKVKVKATLAKKKK